MPDMTNEERVRELAKTLLEMRMVMSQSEAEERARAIVSHTPDEGPPVSTMAPPKEAAMSWNQVPSQMDRAKEMLSDISGNPPAPGSLKEAESQAQSVIKDAQEFDKTAAQVEQLKEDETKERLDSDELIGHIKLLRKELEESRKEIAALRAKMGDIEKAVAKAMDIAQKVAPTSTPQQQAAAPPSSQWRQAPAQSAPEQKPRGQNPTVDLTKIFGRK
jgi:DNA repair exonuclease SbcCD ATPase subunit